MTTDLCVAGRTIGPQRKPEELPEYRRHGPCELCKNDPLHGVGLCECSFRRDGMRLCRRCAVTHDIERQGWSPLLTREENDSIQLANSFAEPGRIVHQEGEQEYQFVVRVSSFGTRRKAKQSVTTSLLRALNLTFGDNVVVTDKSTKRIIAFDPKAHGIGGSMNGNGNGSR